NGKPDALSRRWDHRPEGGSEAQQPVLSLFKPDQLWLAASKVVRLAPTFKERLLQAAAGDAEYQKLKDAIQNGKTEKASQWSLEDEVIHWKDRWYIPNHQGLRLAILKDNHDSRAAGHFGVHKTIERLRQNFHWPNMDGDATDYVKSCDICQRDKSSRHKKYGLLEPLQAPYRPWTSISMDWIVELPESNGYTQIWVVVDRLTKMAHFIPLPTNTDAKDLAHSFLRNIWKLHGPPDEIISDRDTRINSHFWQELMDLIGVKSAMSTAYHPETDGQTERVNQTLEQYLRHYCSWKQDNWEDLLALAEFAYNSAVSEATGMSPFYANYGQEPRLSWEPIGKQRHVNPASQLLERMWEATWLRLREMLAKNRDKMIRQTANKRMAQPAYKVGDLVMVDSRNMKSKRPSKKLDHKKIGPFKIIKLVGKRACRVQLPGQIKVHPTFHVSMLEPYRKSIQP